MITKLTIEFFKSLEKLDLDLGQINVLVGANGSGKSNLLVGLDGKAERQVLMTAHNPAVLDGLPLENDKVRLFTVGRSNTGRTVVRRVEVTPDILERVKKGWSISRLWMQGHLGGVPHV